MILSTPHMSRHSVLSVLIILISWLLFPASAGRLGCWIPAGQANPSSSSSSLQIQESIPDRRGLPSTGSPQASPALRPVTLMRTGVFPVFSRIRSSIILSVQTVRNCRAEIPPRPVSQDVHPCTAFCLYRLNYAAHTLQLLWTASSQFLPLQTVTLPVPTDNTFQIALICRIYLTWNIATLSTVISRTTTPHGSRHHMEYESWFLHGTLISPDDTNSLAVVPSHPIRRSRREFLRISRMDVSEQTRCSLPSRCASRTLDLLRYFSEILAIGPLGENGFSLQGQAHTPRQGFQNRVGKTRVKDRRFSAACPAACFCAAAGLACKPAVCFCKPDNLLPKRCRLPMMPACLSLPLPTRYLQFQEEVPSCSCQAPPDSVPKLHFSCTRQHNRLPSCPCARNLEHLLFLNLSYLNSFKCYL